MKKKVEGKVREGSLDILIYIRADKSFSSLQFCLPTFSIPYPFILLFPCPSLPIPSLSLPISLPSSFSPFPLAFSSFSLLLPFPSLSSIFWGEGNFIHPCKNDNHAVSFVSFLSHNSLDWYFPLFPWYLGSPRKDRYMINAPIKALGKAHTIPSIYMYTI